MKKTDSQVKIEQLVKSCIEKAETTLGAEKRDKKNSTPDKKSDVFIKSFNTKPSELELFLKKYVVKQEKAIRVLSTKICGHFNAIRNRLEKGEDPMNDIDRIKSNILLIGSTGVGKTYLLKLIAKKLGVPFIKVDATKYTEAGYVGGDVEDIIRDLAENTKDSEGNIDVGMAQFGMVFIDEADKIASTKNSIGIDVSRKGVQQALLTLIEEADVALKSKLDFAEQVRIAEMVRQGSQPVKTKINTRNILFIFSGAFPGIEGVIEKRLNKKLIGFNTKSEEKKKKTNGDYINQIQTADLISYGFEAEFIGRIPVRAALDELDENDLYQILKKDGSPIIKQFKEVMQSYGTEVNFDDEVLRFIATSAAKEKTGARGLLSVFDETFRDYENRLPDIKIPEFDFVLPLINGEINTGEFLNSLDTALKEKTGRMQTEQYIQYIRKEHGLNITFTDGALQEITNQTNKEKKDVLQLCREIFSASEAGFALLKKNGKAELVITDEAVKNPFAFMEKAFKE